MAGRKTTRKKAAPIAGGPRTHGRLQRALDQAARREIRKALAEAEGSVVEAARLLGISRISLWKRMTALDIRP